MKKQLRVLTILSLTGLVSACASAPRRPQAHNVAYELPTGKILSDIDIERTESFDLQPKAIRFIPKECRVEASKDLDSNFDCTKSSQQ